jgi:hypothetical protein
VIGMRWVVLAVGVVSAIGCTGVATSLGGRPGPEAGLLRGKSPTRSSGVTHVDRLTDGIASAPDDPSVTDLTSVFASPEAFVVYDLEKETPIACVAIVADADDRYTISLSHDGQSYTPLWSAPALEDHGMEPRAEHGLAGTGRWLRLTASGGDGRYAVSELSVADVCPPRWPPALAMQQGTRIEQSLRLKIWAFAALGAAFILGYRRRAPDFIKLLVAVPVGVGMAAAVQLADLWPPPASIAGLIAAAAGIIAGAVGLRIAVGRLWRRYRGSPAPKRPAR